MHDRVSLYAGFFEPTWKAIETVRHRTLFTRPLAVRNAIDEILDAMEEEELGRRTKDQTEFVSRLGAGTIEEIHEQRDGLRARIE